MRINNNFYAVQDDLIVRYSRTFQALKSETSGNFDAVFADGIRQRAAKRDTLLAAEARKYFSPEPAERDTLITAETQSEMSKRFDAMFVDKASRTDAEHDTLLAAEAQKYSSPAPAGRDMLILANAQDARLRSLTVYERYDPIMTARRNGEAT